MALSIRRAFTLVELLAAVAIIVVLLALLTPDLDRAIYHAELAVCASQLRAIAMGSTVYATGDNRSYAYRYYRNQGADGRANAINYPDWGDDRPVFEGVVSLEALVDPFVDKIRIDAGSGSGTETYIYITRTVWAGWQYPGYRGMMKLGDVLNYKDLDHPGNTLGFDVLAADLDQLRTNMAEAEAAHPDEQGLLALSTVVPGTPRVLPHMFSQWRLLTGIRGTIDAFNYAHSDGSVSRLLKVEPSHGQNLPGDERLRGLNINHLDYTEYNFYLPPAR